MGTMVERYGQWALVTGASSGIGAEFATQLAAQGMNLVLVARRRDRMETLRDEICAKHPVEVRIEVFDLGTQAGALCEVTNDLEIGMFVNNAGFGAKGEFLKIPLEEQLRMIQLNCVTVAHLSHHFLGKMVECNRGALIITASTGAYQSLPYSAVYGATKAFDLHLGEALYQETKSTDVDVLTLCPGATDTEGPIRTGVDPDAFVMMSSHDVVAAALRGLGRRPVVIPGFKNRIGAFFTKLFPRPMATRIAGNLILKSTGDK